MKGNIPCPRASFMGVLINNSKILIHGGCNEEEDFDSAFILDLSMY